MTLQQVRGLRSMGVASGRSCFMRIAGNKGAG